MSKEILLQVPTEAADKPLEMWEREPQVRIRFDGKQVRKVTAYADTTTHELVEFGGFAVIQFNGPQGSQAVPLDFPIGNCKTWDEAFAAFDEAARLHCQVLNVQQNVIAAQLQQQQSAAQRKAQIDKALNGVGGIEIARR